MPERWTEFDRFLEDLFGPSDPALGAALEASAAAGLPRAQVSPAQGRFLMLLARLAGARSILEIGTLGGYSTIWLARGLAPGGRVLTLESDPRRAALARANLERAGLGLAVDVLVGRALDLLPKIAAAGRGPFDLIFLDADKTEYAEYLEWAILLSRRGTLLVADNVVRGGAVADAGPADPSVRGARRFLERLATEPRLDAAVLQTVGVKGHDGFALAVVT